MKFKPTSRFLTALLFSVTLLLPAISNAANLISVIVADTMDYSIGESVKIDSGRMQAIVKQAARFTDLNPIEICLTGNDTTSTNVLKKLDELSVSQEDVVIFYFAGHGYHLTSEQNSTPWPNLYFSVNGQGLFFEKIIKDLESKKPRLLLAIADVCNSLIPDSHAPLRARAHALKSSYEDIREYNYKQLFLETSGTIKVAGSSVGEFAWGGYNGAIFTYSFANSLNEAVTSTTGVDWNLILANSYIRTAILTSQTSTTQHPYYEVELSERVE